MNTDIIAGILLSDYRKLREETNLSNYLRILNFNDNSVEKERERERQKERETDTEREREREGVSLVIYTVHVWIVSQYGHEHSN